MSKKLRLKLLAIAGVTLIFGMVAIYPPLADLAGWPVPSWLQDKRVKLGLDLRGGVHLAMRVDVEYALRAETDDQVARLVSAAAAIAVPPLAASVIDATHFSITPPGQDLGDAWREAVTAADTSYERREESGRLLFSMRPGVEARLREETVTRTRETIERRVNELGVAEAAIARRGSLGDELVMQLPGVSDLGRAKALIRAGGVLEFRLVQEGPAPSTAGLATVAGANDVVIVEESPDGQSGHEGAAYYALRQPAVVTGRQLRDARPSLDENGRPAVSFSLDADGGRAFAAATTQNIGARLAIVLDGTIQSVARIDTRIASQGSIHGSFTSQEAQDLAVVLRSGALPAPVTYLEEEMVGASLGRDSIRSGIVASASGLLLVMAFMLIYYRRAGVNATVALLLNLIILLGLMGYSGAVMTLPGIAGFVLTMGIGVDSNVLVFERIKEELEAGSTNRVAVSSAFSRVFLTLLDTHIAALVAAAFLFAFGTGPIRGFAVTLSVGLASNLFTSTFVSRTLFELALSRGSKARPLSI